jgi:CheY-like chemotaxis protein
MFVLVVDDNLLSCTRLLGQVRAAGWDARAAGPGPEGMTLARQKRPDVIVVNLAATSHDAALFIGAVKAEPDLAPIPVLGFCGHRDVTRREAAAAAGCDRVVANSAVAAGLPALVRTLAAGSTWIGPRR